MARFISIPAEIEAFAWYKPGHANHKPVAGVRKDLKGNYFVITIQNQKAYLNEGDWVVAESNGVNHYLIDPSVLIKRYNPIPEEEAAEASASAGSK